MALKALIIRKKLDLKQKELDALNVQFEDLEKRSAELEKSINEVESDEERSAVEEEIDKYERDKESLESVKAKLEEAISAIEAELEAEETEDAKDPEEDPASKTENRGNGKMEVKEIELRAFNNYVHGIETRDDYNMVAGNNGDIIPKTIAKNIIEKVEEICPIFKMATRYNTKGKLEIPFYPASADHVVAAAYTDDFGTLYASQGDFDAVELTGFTAGALSLIGKKLINNTDINVVSFIEKKMADAFAKFFEHECLIGTSGKSTGLAGSSLPYVTAAKKSTIELDDLITLQCKVPDVYQSNACWIMKPATRELIRKLKDENGRPLLQPDVAAPFGYMLLGKPVYVSDQMQAMGTEGNQAIYYGDMSGLAVKLTEDLEIQVLREHYATKHAVGIVGWCEIDTKVENAQKIAVLKAGSSDS